MRYVAVLVFSAVDLQEATYEAVIRVADYCLVINQWYPLLQKTGGVSTGMNALDKPSVARRAKEGVSRRISPKKGRIPRAYARGGFMVAGR